MNSHFALQKQEQESLRLEKEEARVREEAATTAVTYETQLSVMSEHLARSAE